MAVIVPEPEAPENIPVPPVIEKEPVELKTAGFEVGHVVELGVETKIMSPFEAVWVSSSVPTTHVPDEPVMAFVNVSVKLPSPAT